MKGYCLDYKDNKENHLCTMNYCKNNKNLMSGHMYSETNLKTMEELLEYALNMGENVEIPKGYKVTELYYITCSTANFDPKARKCSTVSSSIIRISKNKDVIDEAFKRYVRNSIDKNSKDMKHLREHEDWFCWHTEDYAYNQVIHSYNKQKIYLIEKEGNDEDE